MYAQCIMGTPRGAQPSLARVGVGRASWRKQGLSGVPFVYMTETGRYYRRREWQV